MARAALRWSVLDLAGRANVGKTTIIRFENDLSSPIPSTLTVLKMTFEQAGLEFLDSDGVRRVHRGVAG
jgi:transcriptional regulator with XRE-family HTH domain